MKRRLVSDVKHSGLTEPMNTLRMLVLLPYKLDATFFTRSQTKPERSWAVNESSY